ncbi:hypothetical protein GCM10009716_41490 [Streptomyces sodiiphilus]|uniref:N-terminal domain-containing protein n=1 Tax=Streptomyces sodiiphilus TaxID=226217 RepID=A0ABN2PSG5_9ACTN
MPAAPVLPPKPVNRHISQEGRAEARKIRRRWMNDTADWAIRQFTDPEGWRRFLWTAAYHPTRPTVTNLALLAVQAPFEICRTYRQWQTEGRQVRKDEHGALIYTSVLKAEDDGPEKLRGFGCGSLFRYSQTDPADGADTDQQPPGPPHPRRPEELAEATRIHTPQTLHTGAQAIREALHALTSAAPDLSPAEAGSAAHLAALTLDTEPGAAPPLASPETDDPDAARDALRDAAQRVTDTGRAVAAQVAAIHHPPF